MKIAAACLAVLATLAGSAHAASNAALRAQARSTAQKYIATHNIGAVRPSVRVAFKPDGRIEAGIYGRLRAKGKGGVGIVTMTRFPLYIGTFERTGQKLVLKGGWKALPRPQF